MERGEAILEHSTGRARRPRQDHPRTRGRAATRGSRSPPTSTTSRTAELVVEAVPENLDLKQRLFAQLDAIVRPRRRPRHEHLLAVGHRDRGRHGQPQAGRRHALLQPRAGAAVRRGHPHGHHRRRRLRGRQGARRAARQEAGHRRRQGRVHRQRAAVRLPQPRGVDVRDASYASREDIDAAMRLGCGYPMGPLALLDLIGLDTAYEILDTMYKQGRDRLHAPSPIIKQMVSAGLLGPQDAAAASTPMTRRARPRSSPTRRRPPRGPPPAGARPVRAVGVVGSGTMATGIVEVFAKAGYDVDLRRPQRGQGRRRSGPRSTRSLAEGRGARQARPRRTPTRARPGHRAPTALDALADVDLVVEAVAEDLAVKQELFATSTRSASPAPSSPRRPRRCRSSTAPRSPRGRRTSSACTSSTRPRS